MSSLIRDLIKDGSGKGGRLVKMAADSLGITHWPDTPKVLIIDSLECAIVTVGDEHVGMFVVDYEECDVKFKKLC